jgi:ligand-binding sensor domain-containing protein
VLVDREGTLWIGTSSGGINRMRDGEVTHVDDDLSIPKIKSLYQDRNGGIWAGTEKGLLRFQGRKSSGRSPECPPRFTP